VTPAAADTVTGLQGGANVNFAMSGVSALAGIKQTTLASDTSLTLASHFSGANKALILNTGASGNVNYTLPQCTAQTSNPYFVTFYGIAAQTMTVLPYSGDNFYLASTAYATSLVSGAGRQTFITLGCFVTGHWDLTGQNGSWTGN
jgi:hypothetical protein